MLKAKEIKFLMAHKNDIMFGVISRANHQIQMEALAGKSGTIFEYPAEYEGFYELEIFYHELEEDGYTVIELPSTEPDTKRIAIYWDT